MLLQTLTQVRPSSSQRSSTSSSSSSSVNGIPQIGSTKIKSVSPSEDSKVDLVVGRRLAETERQTNPRESEDINSGGGGGEEEEIIRKEEQQTLTESFLVGNPQSSSISIIPDPNKKVTLTSTKLHITPVVVVTSNPSDSRNTHNMADKRRYYDRSDGSGSGSNNYYGNNNSDYSSSRNQSSKGSGGGGGTSGGDYDDPPNSRLFILCGRCVGEDELRTAFDKFGSIKELWIVKDRVSGDSKGVAYITYTKTSEAAVAMEEMNGKFIGNNAKPLKVLVANSRDQGSRREVNEEERLLRLFIIVPKSMTEAEVKDNFSQFGDVERCNIVRERSTKESKGYAYVTFHRISHAAKAYEGCDRSFKPKFADPRPQKQHGDDRYSSAHGSTTGPYEGHEYNLIESYPQIINHHHQHDQHAHLSIQHQSPVHVPSVPSSTSSLLTVVAHGSLNQDQLWRLCDFFPGLDYCDVRHDSKSRQVIASVVYKTPQAASYAKEKLHGFEYPPGNRLIVKFESVNAERSTVSLLGPPVAARYTTSHNGGVQTGSLVTVGQSGSGRTPPLPDLARISETFAQAQSLLQAQAHHINSYAPPAPSSTSLGESYDPSYCSVKLPAPQPLAPIDSLVMERLFVVCHPSPPQLYALKDVFGRFGNLIDIFMLNGKNFGYAKYANKVSADEAKSVLHGQEVCGMRLKVFLADPQDSKSGGGGGSTGSTASSHSSTDQKCKRLRMDTKDDTD